VKLFDAPLVEGDEGDGPPKARAEEALDAVGRPGRALLAARG